MPKNNPRKDRPQKPRNPGVGGGGGDSTGGEVLLIQLVKLNDEVLPSLEVGNAVSTRAVGPEVQVFTSLGTYIGAVSPQDADALAGKKVKRSRLFAVQINPPRCVVEVIV